jgi:hypothetical protein
MMHTPMRLLICTDDAETQFALQAFAENHPDVTGFRIVESWTEALGLARRFEMIFADTHLLSFPEALKEISPQVSVFLLAKDPNDCRRFRGSSIRGCLITPINFEAFQWTIRSMQPIYAEEMA